MTVKGPLNVGVALAGLATLSCGILLLQHLENRTRKIPKLMVTGSSHESGEGVVSFRILFPEAPQAVEWHTSNPQVIDDSGQIHREFRKAAGFVFSKPQVIDTAGKVQDVALIRYVTPANEPSVGTIQDSGGAYRLQLDVAFEERGVAGWTHRARNCWLLKTLQPLRETTFGDPVTISSDWISNSVVRSSWSSQ